MQIKFNSKAMCVHVCGTWYGCVGVCGFVFRGEMSDTIGSKIRLKLCRLSFFDWIPQSEDSVENK